MFYWSKDDIGRLPSNLEKRLKVLKIKLSKSETIRHIKRKADLTDEIINTGLSTTNPKKIPIYLIKKIRDILVAYLKNKQKFRQGLSFLSNFKYLLNGVINQKYNDFYAKKS